MLSLHPWRRVDQQVVWMWSRMKESGWNKPQSRVWDATTTTGRSILTVWAFLLSNWRQHNQTNPQQKSCLHIPNSLSCFYWGTRFRQRGVRLSVWRVTHGVMSLVIWGGFISLHKQIFLLLLWTDPRELNFWLLADLHYDVAISANWRGIHQK